MTKPFRKPSGADEGPEPAPRSGFISKGHSPDEARPPEELELVPDDLEPVRGAAPPPPPRYPYEDPREAYLRGGHHLGAPPMPREISSVEAPFERHVPSAGQLWEPQTWEPEPPRFDRWKIIGALVVGFGVAFLATMPSLERGEPRQEAPEVLSAAELAAQQEAAIQRAAEQAARQTREQIAQEAAAQRAAAAQAELDRLAQEEARKAERRAQWRAERERAREAEALRAREAAAARREATRRAEAEGARRIALDELAAPPRAAGAAAPSAGVEPTPAAPRSEGLSPTTRSVPEPEALERAPESFRPPAAAP